MNEYNKDTPFDKRIADVEDKIQKLQDRLSRLKELKQTWNDLPFKEGEVAFHKEYGNVLISSVDYGPRGFETEKDENIFYNIVTHKRSTVRVAYKDLLPTSDATKILYTNTK